MKRLTTVLFVLGSFTLSAQTLDLTQPKIELVSGLSHMSSEKGEIIRSEKPAHEGQLEHATTDIHAITIDTKTKRIKIVHQRSGEVVYDVAYSASFQGAGQSVSLQPHESMFMVRDEKVNMITHNSETETMHVIWKDNQIELFGYLTLKGEDD